LKTRYTSLVSLKKNSMQKSERAVQSANADLNNASIELELSYQTLQQLQTPQTGNMQEMLASRSLLTSQRGVINHNHEWVSYAQEQVLTAKEQFKKDMIEHEKFKYLELQEIKKILKAKKIQEMKDLDEVALMTYTNKGKK